jgi:SWI/SNF-related matrix-associated actin-dependent regulator 1 of chromatin subfamily A
MLALKVFKREEGVYLFLLQAEQDLKRRVVRYRGDPPLAEHVSEGLRALPGVTRTRPLRLDGMQKAEALWRVEIAQHDAVVAVLREEEDENVRIETVPVHVRDMLVKPVNALPTRDAVARRIGPFWDQLRPFQQEGVRFVVSRAGRAIIADEMGLGKSYQAMGILQYYREARPALVLCPSAVTRAWVDHLRLALGVEARLVSSWKDDVDPTGITVLSYGMVNSKKFAAKMVGFRPAMVVVDESTNVKSVAAQRTRAVFAWARITKYCVLLSGTPMNRPVELYSQLKCLHSWLFPRLFHYRHALPLHGTTFAKDKKTPAFFYGSRYCGPTTKHMGRRVVFELRGSANLPELHALLERHCMIRRLKADVLPQLPAKTMQRVVIDTFTQKVPTEFKNNAEMMEHVRETAAHKQKHVEDFVKQIILEELRNNPEQRVLIWAHHHFMLDALHEAFVSGLGPDAVVTMDGRTSGKLRGERVAQFQDPNSRVRVAVLGLSAMCTGVTLTAATEAVFAELAWGPDVMQQAVDRMHRLGQRKPVRARFLLAQGSTDDMMWAGLQNKVGNAALTLDNQRKRWRTSEQLVSTLPRKKQKVK